jgi:dipeptidyl aminopeptidase/acylaminoacyl peptidase
LNDAKQDWDLSIRDVLYSDDGKSLYVVAERRGRNVLFSIDLVPQKNGQGYEPATAKALTSSGAVSSIHLVNSNSSDTPARLLVNSSSLVESSKVSILSPSLGHEVVLSSATENGALLGISPAQVSEFSFQGAGDYPVQSFICRPSNFRTDKTYPCMLAVHGGPNSAWQDGWSARWNMIMFAEQGYIVIAPNITGSTGFGEAFAEAVSGDWGGRAYGDLEKCWEYVEENLKYVDTDRAVILGASYGGKF